VAKKSKRLLFLQCTMNGMMPLLTLSGVGE